MERSKGPSNVRSKALQIDMQHQEATDSQKAQKMGGKALPGLPTGTRVVKDVYDGKSMAPGGYSVESESAAHAAALSAMDAFAPAASSSAARIEQEKLPSVAVLLANAAGKPATDREDVKSMLDGILSRQDEIPTLSFRDLAKAQQHLDAINKTFARSAFNPSRALARAETLESKAQAASELIKQAIGQRNSAFRAMTQSGNVPTRQQADMRDWLLHTPFDEIFTKSNDPNASKKDWDSLRSLLAAGTGDKIGPDGHSPLTRAIENNQLDLAKAAILAGASVSPPRTDPFTPSEGVRTPLWTLAAQDGQRGEEKSRLLELMLDKGADPADRFRGKTATEVAHSPTVKATLKAAADEIQHLNAVLLQR